MTSSPTFRLLRLAAVALVGIAAVACSGDDAPDAATSGSAVGPTIDTGAGVDGSDPSSTTGNTTVAPGATGVDTSQPGVDGGAVTTVLPPPPTGQGATVPVATIAPQPATPIGTPAADAGGLQFAIDSLVAVEGEASAPGEIGGPALQVTLRATNTSTAPIDLALTLVDLRHGTDETPASPFSIGTTPFAGSLAPGASVTGVYVFGVPAERRAQLRIYVNARPELPAVVFEGSAG